MCVPDWLYACARRAYSGMIAGLTGAAKTFRAFRPGALSSWGWGGAALFFLCLSMPGRPVETLILERQSGPGRTFPVPLGHTVTTRYMHSVERTPVEDVYCVMNGRLHQRRTRTRSHNAGLPWQAPEQGRFVREGAWLVLEGGRNSWSELYLRVGDDCFGRNELFAGGTGHVVLYRDFPGERLRFSAGRKSFIAGCRPQ